MTAVDHGGILADQRDAAEQVADALARQPDPSLAARSDPLTVDRRLRDQVAEHERVLVGRPPNREKTLAASVAEADRARAWLANMDAIAENTARHLADLGRRAGLTRQGRDHRRSLEDKLAGANERAAAARHTYDEVAGRAAQLRNDQDLFERFESDESWRRKDVARRRDQLDHHWARVVTDCVKADDPLAFGIDELRHARATAAADLDRLDAAIPTDRITEWGHARQQLPDNLRARHDAEQALAERQAALQDAGKRRWGRHNQEAIAAARANVAAAEQKLEQTTAAERNLRERLDALALYHQQRQQAITATAARGTSSRQAWLSSTPLSTIPAPTASERSSTTPPSTWSFGSGRRPPHPLVGPCGAITPGESRQRSTATTGSCLRRPPVNGRSVHARK